MKCRNCRRQIDDNSIFCNWCGSKQIKEKKKEIKVPEPVKRGTMYWIYLRKEGISVTEPTYEACKAKAIAARAGFVAKAETFDKITLTKAIDNYIEDRRTVLSPETIRGYRIIQNNRFKSLMDEYVHNITPAMCQREISKAVADGLSPKTVSNTWHFIKAVMDTVEKRDIEVRLPQMIRKEKNILDSDGIKKFCEKVKGNEIEIYCLLALHSLRNSEIMALQWGDIDLTAKTINVRKAVVRDENNKFVEKVETKNVSSRRVIPIMMDQLYDALSAADQSQPIFKYTGETYARWLDDFCKDNGFPHLSPHCLRHTFASLALTSLNMPESVVMQLGGWSTDSTMKRVYRHAAQSEIEKNARAMTDFYNKKPDPKPESEEPENVE